MFRNSRPFYDMEVVIIAARLCGNLENKPSRKPVKGNEGEVLALLQGREFNRED